MAYFRIKYRIHYLYYIVRPNPRIVCGEQNLAKLSEKNNNTRVWMPTSHTYIYTNTNTYIEALCYREKKRFYLLYSNSSTHFVYFFFRFAFSRIYMLSTFVCHDSVYPKAYMKPSSSFSVLCFLNRCISIYISVNTVCSWKFSSFCSFQQFHLISAWFLHVHIALFAFHCTWEIFSRGFLSTDFS